MDTKQKTFEQAANDLRKQLPQDIEAFASQPGPPSRRWIYKFKAGSIPNPGVKTLDALAAALSKFKR